MLISFVIKNVENSNIVGFIAAPAKYISTKPFPVEASAAESNWKVWISENSGYRQVKVTLDSHCGPKIIFCHAN